MITEKALNALIGPHVSEKAAGLADSANQHVFRVALDADKATVKRAVEGLFKVNVVSVQIARCKGKNKRFGRLSGRRSDWKKAYVKLAPGQDIELGEIGSE